MTTYDKICKTFSDISDGKEGRFFVTNGFMSVKQCKTTLIVTYYILLQTLYY